MNIFGLRFYSFTKKGELIKTSCFLFSKSLFLSLGSNKILNFYESKDEKILHSLGTFWREIWQHEQKPAVIFFFTKILPKLTQLRKIRSVLKKNFFPNPNPEPSKACKNYVSISLTDIQTGPSKIIFPFEALILITLKV